MDELQPERSLSYNPLIQVGIILQNFPIEPISLPGLTWTPRDFEFRAAKLDLFFLLTEAASGLDLVVEYNTDLFDEATIRRICERFESLLTGIVTLSGRPIAELPLLPESERRQLLVDLNRTEMPLAAGRCVHHLFEQQAERTPDAVAIVDVCGQPSGLGEGYRRLTYRDLEARVNRLSSRLRDLGVGPEVKVALYLDRLTDLLASMLAVLKAGGAYVPLDTGSPPERLARMWADVGRPIVITQQSRMGAFRADRGRSEGDRPARGFSVECAAA